MSSYNDIQKFLKTRGAKFISAFRLNELSGTLLLEVPLDHIREKAGRGFTSKRQLSSLGRAIEEKFHLRVLVAVRDSEQLLGLESGLRSVLLHRYPNHVTDTYMSFPTGDTTLVWVVLKEPPDELMTREIQGHINSFLSDAGLTCENIEFLTPSSVVPSLPAILRSVKIKAPVDLAGIMDDLTKKGLFCPNERWLSGKLDSARKRGLLVRSRTGVYSLTSLGLEAVPHTRSRTSSDIERILLLAKRRQW